jgi:hypothetical protein
LLIINFKIIFFKVQAPAADSNKPVSVAMIDYYRCRYTSKTQSNPHILYADTKALQSILAPRMG